MSRPDTRHPNLVLVLPDPVSIGLCIRLYIKIGKESQKTHDENTAKNRRRRVTRAVADVRQVRPVREREVLVH